MRIALVDELVTVNNPVGSLHRLLLGGLADEHEFVVFAIAFDNPRPDRIEWVRVPAPRRPLVLQFLVFHITASLAMRRHRRRRHVAFDVVHSVGTNRLRADVVDVHFCDRVYLRDHWRRARPQGLRRPLGWLLHRLHALLEPGVFRRAHALVTPSAGSAAELAATYPAVATSVQLIHNPVDRARMTRPDAFDRVAQRAELGIGNQLTLVFVALGHFDRKGLPVLLEALAQPATGDSQLIVVGGLPDLVARFERSADALGIADRVHFVGTQPDVRPSLWASDAFILPSAYEAFPLVALEAAAAGLALVATPLNGVDEILVDGVSGLKVERDATSIAHAIARLSAYSSAELRAMGGAAAEQVAAFDPELYVDGWRQLYAGLSPTSSPR